MDEEEVVGGKFYRIRISHCENQECDCRHECPQKRITVLNCPNVRNTAELEGHRLHGYDLIKYSGEKVDLFCLPGEGIAGYHLIYVFGKSFGKSPSSVGNRGIISEPGVILECSTRPMTEDTINRIRRTVVTFNYLKELEERCEK